jgi:hypothetical protein
MKFGTVEDHYPGIVFHECLRIIYAQAGLLRPENLLWPNHTLHRKLYKI